MKVIVTCGPSYEPIDQVRRLTNFSTGELGVLISNELALAGHDVFCLKGSGATHPGPDQPCHISLFNTNDDLLKLLIEAAGTQEIGAVFHVAALCDYKIKHVTDAQGRTCDSPKIASRSGALTLQLEPATKVIAQMRRLFPHGILVGWKYELAGTRDDALCKARKQIDENRLDACVVNGAAYGSCFGFCRPDPPIDECQDKQALARYLAAILH